MIGLGIGISGQPGLGPELIVNGDGEATGSWSSPRSNSTLSSTGGRIRTTATTAAVWGVSQEVTGLVIGASYRFKIQVFNAAGHSLFVRFSTGATLPGSNVATGSGDIDFTGNVTPTAATMYLGVVAGGAGIADFFEIDNVSLRRV